MTENIYDIMRKLDRGQLHKDLNESINEVVEAVHHHGGNGSVTIKINVKRDDATQSMRVRGDVTKTTPKRTRKESVFYFNEDEGGLMRADPNQHEIPAVRDADEINKIA